MTKPWVYVTPRTGRHPQAYGEVRYEMFVVEYSGVSLSSAALTRSWAGRSGRILER